MFRTALISICLICSATSAKTPVYEDFKLLASDSDGPSDNFGDSVSISSDGSTAIVGASGDSNNGIGTGSAYTFDGWDDVDDDGIPNDIDNCFN